MGLRDIDCAIILTIYFGYVYKKRLQESIFH